MGLPMPKVVEVTARQNKMMRAEPLVSASERGRVHLVNRLPELEDQLTGWVAGESGYSPDRMDAFVYSLLPVLFDIKGGSPMARTSISSVARQHYQLTPAALGARPTAATWGR